jgi:hypothetical protein
MSEAANTNNDHGNDLAGKNHPLLFWAFKFFNVYTMLVIMTLHKNKIFTKIYACE